MKHCDQLIFFFVNSCGDDYKFSIFLLVPIQKCFSHFFFSMETLQEVVFSVVLCQNQTKTRIQPNTARVSNAKQQNIEDVQIDSSKQQCSGTLLLIELNLSGHTLCNKHLILCEQQKHTSCRHFHLCNLYGDRLSCVNRTILTGIVRQHYLRDTFVNHIPSLTYLSQLVSMTTDNLNDIFFFLHSWNLLNLSCVTC